MKAADKELPLRTTAELLRDEPRIPFVDAREPFERRSGRLPVAGLPAEG